MDCPKCGQAQDAGANFCPKCGTALTGAERALSADYVRCPDCRGQGRWQEECGFCNGGLERCDYCLGSGIHASIDGDSICRYCGGSGEKACVTCGGHGMVAAQCDTCGATGWMTPAEVLSVEERKRREAEDARRRLEASRLASERQRAWEEAARREKQAKAAAAAPAATKTAPPAQGTSLLAPPIPLPKGSGLFGSLVVALALIGAVVLLTAVAAAIYTR